MANFFQPHPRLLSKEERALIEWLIANGNRDAHRYASQIANLRVVGRCTCGCPTIDLAVGDRAQRKNGPSLILADFDGKTPEGIDVGVILHGRDGEISELEIYPFADVNGPFSLPTIASLRFANQA
jgi:hypothetical protein